jgi:hypothetical protein
MTMWATHIKDLEDVSEYANGIHYARDRAASLAKSSVGERRDFFRAVGEALTFRGDDQLLDGYVVSFCEAPDRLTLWKSYSPPDAGVSVGYDWSADTSTTVLMTKCIYAEEEKEAVIDQMLADYAIKDPSTVVARLAEHRHEPPSWITAQQLRGIGFALDLMMYAPAFKHAAFLDEREWRVLVVPGRPFTPRVRTRNGRSVRYAEIPLEKDGELCVESVWVGPGRGMVERVGTVESLLSQIGSRSSPKFRCGGVRRSEVPLRPL